MPIGAAIGGAVIAGGGAVAAGALGADAQKDAAKTASNTAAANAAASNALQREIYGENKAILSPYANNGIGPSNALNDLLLGTHTYNASAPSTPAPAPASPGGSPSGGALSSYSGPSFNDILALKGNGIPGDMGAAIGKWTSYYGAHPGENPGVTPAQIAALTGDHVQGDQAAVQNIYNAYQNRPATPATPTPTPAAGGGGAGSGGALSAYDQFKKSINYTGRLAEGQNSLESMWAAHGALDSGAASKAAIKFGQNFASNELGNYMNLLASQQAMGLSAAGAVAGVGTTYAGNVAAQNTAAANAAANAALASGNANAGMWGSAGQAAGQIGGALFQYGMQPQPSTTWNPSYASPGSPTPTLPVDVNQGSLYVPGGF